jgi:hypothetical protein
VSNIFISAATMSLKRRFKKITDEPKNKKWFDANLHKVRGNLLNYGKIYSKLHHQQKSDFVVFVYC